jgi:tetratricopeptide (TPR) repeat protein
MTAARLLLVLCAATWLTGCAGLPFGGRGDRNEGPNLADALGDLPEVELPTEVAAKPDRDEVLAAYERVYGLIPDAADNHAVGKRLADLRMSVGEDADIAGGDSDPYAPAVELYESLLEDAEGDGKDEILYQLARAHDLVGDTDQSVDYLNRLITGYPDSEFVVEARFRRAEIAFSREDFREAARDYGYVAELEAASPYWRNAAYMLGWSWFKLGDLDQGLASFYSVIDQVIGAEDADQASDPELLDDTLRVVVLALGYLDGPDTLADEMRRLDRPRWQYLVYQRLADSYLESERYLDSVATWQTFVEENPLDPRAPAAHIGMIETLARADFPSEIRPLKEAFVARYGISSEFWSFHDESVHEGYLPTLKTYLDELAKLAHAEALESGKRRDYLAAAEWYEQIVATFPDDPASAESYFLLGEVYTQAGEHGRAVAAFQTVVHEHPEDPRATEAGYAAILGLDQLVSSARGDEVELWKRFKIDAQVEFAALFPADERAPVVQAAAADSLFELGDYETAVSLADELLTTWPAAAPELKRSALLIVGHGRFELVDYVGAESAYRRLLETGLDEAQRPEVEERLLASIYKQGEAAEAAGDVDGAVANYLRLADLDPSAELAIQGHFDAVAVIEGAGRVEEAAALLAEFRNRYPDHALGRDADKRLADMYERTENWTEAAASYLRMAESADEPEVRRQSLYRAADLYLQMNDLNNAFAYFRDYANRYPEPLELRLEAIDRLDQLAQQFGDEGERRVWLQAKVDVQREMGRHATERATYLAAEAQYVLAEDARTQFDLVHLGHPLPESLKRKQEALRRTVDAFEAVAEYQVAEFATAATFQIADLYTALSRSIMDSDRPNDLSDLELEQYEILLEEQAYPFEEQAISLHEINMRRSWDGIYDEWVKKSFEALSELMPARFDKTELEVAYVEVIY